MTNYAKLAGNSDKTGGKKVRGKPWQPGQSGNPAGRPKSKAITDMMKRIIENPEHMPAIEANMANTLKTKGMAGVILINHFADRIEGKVPDEVTITDLREMPDDELENKLKALRDARS